MLAMFRAALFDLDNTLIDREACTAAASFEALETVGKVPRAAVDALRARPPLIGLSWQDIHRELGIESLSGWSCAQFVAHTMDAIPAAKAKGFVERPLSGAADLVRRLHDNAVKVVVVSGSSRREVEDACTNVLQITPSLEFLIGAEDYVHGKPAPECYLQAAKRLGVEPSECVVFEDSAAGIAAAIAAGAAVIATSEANRPAGQPGHQDQSAADAIVPSLTAVDDALLAKVHATFAARSKRA